LVLEAGFWRLVGHIDALAAHLELPAVVDAAQPLLLVAAEEERGAAVGTVVAQQPHLAPGVAEGDEVFTKDPQAEGWAIRVRELGGHEHREPEAAKQRAHRRAGPDSGQQLVFRLTCHAALLHGSGAVFSEFAGQGLRSMRLSSPTRAGTVGKPVARDRAAASGIQRVQRRPGMVCVSKRGSRFKWFAF